MLQNGITGSLNQFMCPLAISFPSIVIERKISKESIIQEAGFVKSAVVEIILKQEQGWSYIKSGF